MSETDIWDELKKELKHFGLTGKEKSPEHHFDLSVTLTGFYWKKLDDAIKALNTCDTSQLETAVKGLEEIQELADKSLTGRYINIPQIRRKARQTLKELGGVK